VRAISLASWGGGPETKSGKSTYLKYSIIIPAYNEGERIAGSLGKILAYAGSRGWQGEILVVNDGSSDDTPALVEEFAKKHAEVKLLQNPGNRGKGYSVRNGMLQATGEMLLFTDADLSSPIAEASKLFGAIEQGADVAIGSRWLASQMQTQRQSLIRQVYGRVFNLVLRVILGLSFKDTQCGLKAFTRKAANAIFPRQTIERWGFDAELLVIAKELGLKVAEVPVEWAHDSRSKINPTLDGIRMFMETLAIRWNALTGKYKNPSFGADSAPPA